MSADDDKPKDKYPWLAPLGKFLGVVVATAVVSLASSWGLTRDVASEATAAAKVSATSEAKEETGRVEMASAIYLGALAEKIENNFKELDADLNLMDEDIEACDDRAKEALILANVALRLLESRYGRATIERTVERVEREESPVPAPTAKKAKRTSGKLPVYLMQRTE